MKEKRKRGKPITHPPVLNTKTGKIFRTYTEAAKDCNGTRYGVMKTCYGMQRYHRGIIFKFTDEKC